MPVNRAEIAQAHFLENDRAAGTAAPVRIQCHAGLVQTHAGNRALESPFGPVRQFQCHIALGEATDEMLKVPRELVVTRRR